MIPKFRAWFDSEMYEKPVVFDGDLYLDWGDFENGDRYDGAIGMQSTGLFDNSTPKKEIFGNDIVEWRHNGTGRLVRGIVKLDVDFGFWGVQVCRFDDLTPFGHLTNQRVTVLGNIYQNKELVGEINDL